MTALDRSPAGARNDDATGQSTQGRGPTADTGPAHLGLDDVLRTLRRQWWVVLAAIVILGGIALGASAIAPRKYTANAKLLFRDPGFDQNLFGGTVFPANSDPDRAAATNQQLVDLTGVYRRAATRLPSVSAGSLRRDVSINANGKSDLITVAATTRSARDSAAIANVVADAFITFRRDADRSKLAAAQRTLRAGLDRPGTAREQRTSLQSDIRKLELLESVQKGNVELVQRAMPPAGPSSPRTKFNVAVGLAFGLLLGLVLALVRSRLDQRLRTAEDVKVATTVPVLGEIPRTPTISASGIPDDPAVREAFIALRTRLRYFNVDQSLQSITVTSALPGEGKSTVAANLAAAAATLGERVLLIEADLRRPSLAARLGGQAGTGLSEFLSSASGEQPVVRSIRVPAPGRTEGLAEFDVILAGGHPPNPQQLLTSERMRAFLTESSASYDLVIIDSAPVLQVSDSMPLVRMADGVVVVCRIGDTTTDQLSRVTREVTALGGHLLGLAVNASPGRNRGYGYAYYASSPGAPVADTLVADDAGNDRSAAFTEGDDRGTGATVPAAADDAPSRR